MAKLNNNIENKPNIEKQNITQETWKKLDVFINELKLAEEINNDKKFWEWITKLLEEKLKNQSNNLNIA